MLVLSRKVGESIVLDGGIRVTVTQVQGNRVRIGIEAPLAVGVRRAELAEFTDPGAAHIESNCDTQSPRSTSLHDSVAAQRDTVFA